MLLDHFFTILLVGLKYLDKSAELFFCLFVFLLLIELVSDVVGLDSLSIEDPLPFLSSSSFWSPFLSFSSPGSSFFSFWTHSSTTRRPKWQRLYIPFRFRIRRSPLFDHLHSNVDSEICLDILVLWNLIKTTKYAHAKKYIFKTKL